MPPATLTLAPSPTLPLHRHETEEITLKCGEASATIAMYGAQLMSFVPASAIGELLWTGGYEVSPGADCWGGVPLCWPWFKNGQGTSPRNPFHGVARFSQWHVAAPVRTNSDGTQEATLEWSGPGARFPTELGQLQATLQVQLGESLQMVLTTRNLGAEPVSVEKCFHSYFNVGDVTRARLHAPCIASELENSFLEREGATARIFSPFAGTVVLDDPALRRTIRLTSLKASHLVLWNSGPRRTLNGRVTGEPEWQTQIALEPLRGLENAVLLEPGQTTSLDWMVTAFKHT